MMKRRRWLWVLLFISVALLLGTLATGWNLVLVRDFRKIPWASLALGILGTLGFVATLGIMILFVIKILKEMRLNQIQSEFLAMVSHELKTPIAALDLASSLIRSGNLTPEETNRLWSSHQQELARLREDVDVLLRAAQFETKPFRVQRTPVVLEAWIRDSVARWRMVLGPDSLLHRTGDALNGSTLTDLKILNMITDNILDNSRKFCRDRPQVTIETRRIPPRSRWRLARWQIEFKDNGLGFDPVHSKKIFNRFFRAPTDASHAIPGTGLGLYIARSASQALGISLYGRSSGNGQGAVFTLEGKEWGTHETAL